MTSIKLSDLLCEFLSLHGVTCIFGVTGGSILHPLHSAHKLGIPILYTHHEQAASFAADAATRLLKRPQACFVTTGPAGTNALTGVLESWLDSIPQIIVSGQARLTDITARNTVRQIGSQHCDIISIVETMTKKAVQITSIENAPQMMLSAIVACNAPRERMGPVWIDFPLDLQWATVDINVTPAELYNDYIKSVHNSTPSNCKSGLSKVTALDALVDLKNSLSIAKRPLALIGSGINFSPYKDKIISLLKEKSIPVVFTWGTIDSIDYDDPDNFGLLGVNGQRCANLAVYLSDCVVGLGTHFSDQITGRDKQRFAPNGKVYMLDIDHQELMHASNHVTGIYFDLNSDTPELIKMLDTLNRPYAKEAHQSRQLIKSLNNISSENLELAATQSDLISELYRYIFKISPSNAIFIADGGGNTFFTSLQNAQPTQKQRVLTSTKTGCMGSGLPQAIGAAFSSPQSKVVCFIGDGSLQFNIQELMTISHNRLDVSIVVINNGGYQAIKDTQNAFFEGSQFGVGASSGLGIPNYHLISEGYSVDYESVNIDSPLLRESIHRCLKSGPHLLEIFIPENVPIQPAFGDRDLLVSDSCVPPIANMKPELPLDRLSCILSITSW